MSRWLHTVNIKDTLNKYENKQVTIVECCKEISKILKESGVDFGTLPSRFSKCFNEDRANNLLSCLYDYGDAHRIWFGL